MDRHRIIESLFGVRRALIGVVHLAGLPGTPSGGRSIGEIVDRAVVEARLYESAGFDGIAIENTHDRPYLKGIVGPEITAAMTAVGLEIRRATSLALGIQVLAAANQSALAIALACGARFIRAEGFVFAHVADEGLIESSAGALLRYRRAIGAESIRVFADVKKKHSSHALTADVDVAETAKAAEFFLADGVIVTGTSTGRPADPAEVRAVAAAVGIPTLIGSGVTVDNFSDYTDADALIVGSSVKNGGIWSDALDESRTRALATAFQAARAAMS
jgi:membrane complex biogenesis BtpA family protein